MPSHVVVDKHVIAQFTWGRVLGFVDVVTVEGILHAEIDEFFSTIAFIYSVVWVAVCCTSKAGSITRISSIKNVVPSHIGGILEGKRLSLSKIVGTHSLFAIWNVNAIESARASVPPLLQDPSRGIEDTEENQIRRADNDSKNSKGGCHAIAERRERLNCAVPYELVETFAKVEIQVPADAINDKELKANTKRYQLDFSSARIVDKDLAQAEIQENNKEEFEKLDLDRIISVLRRSLDIGKDLIGNNKEDAKENCLKRNHASGIESED